MILNKTLSPVWQLGDAATPSLDQLINAFEAAYAAADWLSISQLNDYTQPCVEAEIVAINASAAAAGKHESSSLEALKPGLEKLATIYQAMQQQCAAERDVLSAKLNEVNTGRSATGHYVSTSSL